MIDMKGFWDGAFLGLTYTGTEVNKYGQSYCISKDTPLCVMGREKSINNVIEFLNKRGFCVRETIITESIVGGRK